MHTNLLLDHNCELAFVSILEFQRWSIFWPTFAILIMDIICSQFWPRSCLCSTLYFLVTIYFAQKRHFSAPYHICTIYIWTFPAPYCTKICIRFFPAPVHHTPYLSFPAPNSPRSYLRWQTSASGGYRTKAQTSFIISNQLLQLSGLTFQHLLASF